MIVISNETRGFGSSIYSDEDICDALAVAYSNYEKMMDGYDISLEGMYYNVQCDALIESHKDFATRNNADEVIVILSNFGTSAPAPSGMDEFHDYTGSQWILVRNKGENWSLADCGY